MSQHADYKYSVTIKPKDEAVLNCLRALAQYAQRTGNPRIAWGGTKKKDWKSNNKRVTFRFSSQSFRQTFIDELLRLLPNGLWEKVDERDDNPASPQA